MSNLETVKSALMLYSLQHGFPVDVTTSGLRIFIENFTDLKKLTSTAINQIGRDHDNFILDADYFAQYLGGGYWQIMTIKNFG
jgi:hypothetical protein